MKSYLRNAGFAAILLSAVAPGICDNTVMAASKDMGNGFTDHGVVAPISNHRGMVATVDGNGRNVMLVWIMDHRGGYGLLMIDAETGKTEQFPLPFDNAKKDSPFAAVLSSANKYYTHFGDHFVEFDPVKREFTFSSKTAPQMAMGMTEDHNGVIWSVTYPDSGVVSFDPKSREFIDYGYVYAQNWPQYQRSVASDDAGWVYFAVGNTESQVIAFDPATKKAVPMYEESERRQGSAYVYSNKNGRVYGQVHKSSDTPWDEFYKGQRKKIGADHKPDPRPVITDSQALFYKNFPDGKQATAVDLSERKMTVFDPATSTSKTVAFDYTSEGAVIMATAVAPDGTISGGTAFPMRSFSYSIESDETINRAAYGQWNTVTVKGDKFFVGGYPRGYLLEWDPAKPWVPTEIGNPASNPLFLATLKPDIYRPHCLLALKDNRTIVMGGTPDYGYTGGGLVFWDRQTSKTTLVKHTEILPEHSTFSIIELPDGKLLGGSTTQAGTGGEKVAKQAELYLMDVDSKKVEWHEPVIPGTQTYLSLTSGSDGLVYGIADRKTFFVFDVAKRQVIQQQDLSADLGNITASQQGPRIFIPAEDSLYLLMADGIARVDLTTHKVTRVAKSPTEIEGGGGYKDGRIYYSNGSHLYSYQLKK